MLEKAPSIKPGKRTSDQTSQREEESKHQGPSVPLLSTRQKEIKKRRVRDQEKKGAEEARSERREGRRPQLCSSNQAVASLQSPPTITWPLSPSHMPTVLLTFTRGPGDAVCGPQSTLTVSSLQKDALICGFSGTCLLFLLPWPSQPSKPLSSPRLPTPPSGSTPQHPTGPGSLSLISFICHIKLVQLLAYDFIALSVYFCISSRMNGNSK